MRILRMCVFFSNLLAVMALPTLLHTQSKDSAGTEASCRLFAQDFYDWYLTNTHITQAKMNHMSALEFALKNRRSAFDPNLVRMLDEGRAQAQRDGEPFLDFDPILDSQDPANRYVVKKIALHNGRCSADVYGEPPARQGRKPDVVAGLTFRDAQWLFTDFYYPDAEYPDSKSLLRMLRFLLAHPTPTASDKEGQR